MWWAAENWTEYIHPKLDLFLTHALITHAASPDTVTNVCRDTLNFTRVYAIDPSDSCMPSVLPHFLPFLGFAVTPTAANGCNLERVSVNSEMPVQTDTVGKT